MKWKEVRDFSTVKAKNREPMTKDMLLKPCIHIQKSNSGEENGTAFFSDTMAEMQREVFALS